MRWKKSISSRLITVLKALSLSGRLSVTVITPWSRSVSRSRMSWALVPRIFPLSEAECRCATALFGKHSPQALPIAIAEERHVSPAEIRRRRVMKIVLNRPDAMNALSREMRWACRKRWKRRQDRARSAA